MAVQSADAAALQFQQAGFLVRIMVAGQQNGLHPGIPAHPQETGPFFQSFLPAGAFTGFTEVPAHYQMGAPLQKKPSSSGSRASALAWPKWMSEINLARSPEQDQVPES